MLQSPLLREYAATQARSAFDTRSLRSDIPVGSRDAPHRPAGEWSSWFRF
jgi:hypothetical protein